MSRQFGLDVERGSGGGTSAADIAAAPKYRGLVTGIEGDELDAIAEKGGDADSIIAYGESKNWDENKINAVLNIAMGSSYRSVSNPGGWGNFAFGMKIPKSGKQPRIFGWSP